MIPVILGPLFYPTISTISIGSHTVLEFHKPRCNDIDQEVSTQPTFKLFVEPRSLLILKNDLYHRYMHSISEIEEDCLDDPLIRNLPAPSKETVQRGTRFSLTIRNVPKTSKMKLKFGK